MGNKDSKSPRDDKKKGGLFGGGSKEKEKVSKFSAEEIQSMRERRSKIAEELLQTERVYVQSLNDIVYKWQKPLEDQTTSKAPPCSMEQINLIFSNIASLLKVHTDLLQGLAKKMEGFNDKVILSDIFLENAANLKLYTDYVNNFNISMATIKKCETNANFLNFLSTISVQNSQNGVQFTLSGLMIQPIQRIPRYVMILEDLIKNTWDIHPDLSGLTLAFEEIKKVATFINEQKRQFENTEKLNSLQTKVGKRFEIAAPNRKVEWDGTVVVLSKNKKGDVEKTTANCLLCDDCLFIYQELEEPVKQKSGALSAIKESLKKGGGEKDGSDLLKVHLFGINTQLTLDLGEHDEIEMSEGPKAVSTFKVNDLDRAKWVEMWTKLQAKQKKSGK